MKYFRSLSSILVYLILTSGLAVFAADSDLDPTFSMGSGLGNQPTTLVRQADGKFIVGGNIDTFAGVKRLKIARLNADGSIDTTFTNGTGVDGNGIVWGAAVQSDGRVIIVGEFFSVNGTPRNFVVRLNVDGSLDTSFTPEPSRRVLRVAVQADGKILILGDFQSVNGSFQSRKLARLNSNGTPDPSFTNALSNDIGNTVMRLQPDGKILVAGGPKKLTRLNTDGSVDSAFNVAGVGLTGFINAIDLDSANNIYVGGNIPSYNTVTRTNLIRVFPDGSLDAGFNPSAPDSTFNQGVTAIAAQSDGKVTFSGFFTTVNGTGRTGLARVDNGGALDMSFNPTVPFSGAISQVVVQPDLKVVVGGQFTTVANTPRSRIARLNTDGGIDSTFARKRGPDDTVYSLAPLSDGKVLIGGGFTSVEETPAGVIARLMPNGSVDTSFNSGTGFAGGIVGKLVVQPDGKIIAGGFFTSYNGTSRINIARLNADGTLDSSFNSGSAVDALIADIEVQPDGKIVIVGLFSSVGGISGRHVARLNSDGSVDTSFNPGTGADFEIYDVELQSNGQMLVGGNFDHFNGATRSSIARLNSNGTLDNSFNTATTFDSAVLSIATQPNGLIVVGGAFNNVSGVDRNHVTRLTSSGSQDASFQLGSGFTGDEVYKVALQTDGKIIVGGTFLSIGGAGRPRIARLNANGTVDTAFNVGGMPASPNGDSEVDDIAILPSGKILFAGEFTALNGIEANRVSRLIGTATTVTRHAPFDFDGDGKTDIGIFRPSVAEWWINRSSNGVTTAGQFGASTDNITPADFTGDGKADIAFFRPSTGEWYVLRSEDSSYFSIPFGTTGDIPAPADFDADGKSDATVFRPSTSTWYVRRSTDSGATIQQFGSLGDVPVPGDYDGDGKADIAIYRPSNGQWWLSRSTAGVIATTFGNNSDKPVAGDYTGDGKADIAFWRPSTGEWFVLRSDDFSYYSVPFGTIGDMPAPGDYDGDGKFDTTVFRPSSATWYSQRTTAGILIQQFGSTGDRAIPNAFVP